jgi:hypothetical protein
MGMLNLFGDDMPMFLELLLYIPGHGDVDRAVNIVPLEGYPTIKVAHPIFGECVICL